MDDITRIVADVFQIDKDQLGSMSHAAREAKKIALELACRYGNQSQRKIGEYFEYKGNGSVSKQRQRLRELLNENARLRKIMIKLEKRMAGL